MQLTVTYYRVIFTVLRSSPCFGHDGSNRYLLLIICQGDRVGFNQPQWCHNSIKSGDVLAALFSYTMQRIFVLPNTLIPVMDPEALLSSRSGSQPFSPLFLSHNINERRKKRWMRSLPWARWRMRSQEGGAKRPLSIATFEFICEPTLSAVKVLQNNNPASHPSITNR